MPVAEGLGVRVAAGGAAVAVSVAAIVAVAEGRLVALAAGASVFVGVGKAGITAVAGPEQAARSSRTGNQWCRKSRGRQKMGIDKLRRDKLYRF